MAEIVTLQLPESLAQQAREIAALTHRKLEEVLIEWLDHASADLLLEPLSDEQILVLCDLQMSSTQQESLSELLSRNREGQLSVAELGQLNELMQVYRRGLVRKARAFKVAVERGLRPPLG